MSDECSLGLRIRRSDLDTLKKIVDRDEFDEEQDIDGQPGIVEIQVYEANWGWDDELRQLASRGIPFTGWHGRAMSYGESSFCGWGERFYIVDSVEGGIVADVFFKDGVPTLAPYCIEAIKEYREADDKVEAFFSLNPVPDGPVSGLI